MWNVEEKNRIFLIGGNRVGMQVPGLCHLQMTSLSLASCFTYSPALSGTWSPVPTLSHKGRGIELKSYLDQNYLLLFTVLEILIHLSLKEWGFFFRAMFDCLLDRDSCNLTCDRWQGGWWSNNFSVVCTFPRKMACPIQIRVPFTPFLQITWL